ncbi:transmembrane protein 132E-like protein [Desulfohalobium retbaense DSM 5692]|uniref:Transmembrane protein 132E-like protein n=1 Tax=Desulfohalobium retbaense (strain ATCC 49708 / DSM 5692 / JCM 16813 / HR100) TaxID=485915 RepID=C8X300_DESRD|nr:transmembrane protein 132E-like protein [Desulfohalobium retbaense DSM 5692]
MKLNTGWAEKWMVLQSTSTTRSSKNRHCQRAQEMRGRRNPSLQRHPQSPSCGARPSSARPNKRAHAMRPYSVRPGQRPSHRPGQPVLQQTAPLKTAPSRLRVCPGQPKPALPSTKRIILVGACGARPSSVCHPTRTPCAPTVFELDLKHVHRQVSCAVHGK